MRTVLRLESLAAPLFVLLWSTGFIGAKYGLPYAEPATFLVLRFGLVTLALACWALLARIRWLSWRQAREAALIGVLLQAVYLGGVYQAISMGIEAGVSALIVGLQPVLTAFIARQFLGERLNPVQWAGIALGFLGVGLVVLRKLEAGIGDWRGVAFCLASLVAIAVASILQKRKAADHPVRASTLVQFLAALTFLIPISFAFETREVTWSIEFTLTLSWLVVVMSLGALSLLLYLIRHGAASSVASLFFLVPTTTALMAWPLFGEVLGPVEIGGVVLTTLGVLMVNRPDVFGTRLTRG
ncbi:MAG TPA: DMT family transporter [Thermohalobaculum sp.]|nr:DMT family transporter [Thermohalobaculum sp.]